MKPLYSQIILCSLLLVACASAPAGAQSGEPEFIVTTKNTDDNVNIQHENDAAVIDIESPSGIGAATFELESGVMPAVTLRLHLKGLEDLRVSSDGGTIGASISSGKEPVIRQRLISESTESPLLPGNPAWMEIEIVSSREEKSIPLEEGYFEIRLPAEFLQDAGTSFTVEWIDFYR